MAASRARYIQNKIQIPTGFCPVRVRCAQYNARKIPRDKPILCNGSDLTPCLASHTFLRIDRQQSAVKERSVERSHKEPTGGGTNRPCHVCYVDFLRTPKVPNLWAPAASDFAAFCSIPGDISLAGHGVDSREMYAKVRRKCSYMIKTDNRHNKDCVKVGHATRQERNNREGLYSLPRPMHNNNLFLCSNMERMSCITRGTMTTIFWYISYKDQVSILLSQQL